MKVFVLLSQRKPNTVNIKPAKKFNQINQIDLHKEQITRCDQINSPQESRYSQEIKKRKK